MTGTKIFISSGDHDFGGNLVHLVLARLPDAPKGVKGISLFLPEAPAGADGGLGARNALSVGALKHKMGIHAQPTPLRARRLRLDVGPHGRRLGAPWRTQRRGSSGGKPALARFFVERMLPQTAALRETLRASADSTIALHPDEL